MPDYARLCVTSDNMSYNVHCRTGLLHFESSSYLLGMYTAFKCSPSIRVFDYGDVCVAVAPLTGSHSQSFFSYSPETGVQLSQECCGKTDRTLFDNFTPLHFLFWSDPSVRNTQREH